MNADSKFFLGRSESDMISVITPAHNEADFIVDCLSSVSAAAKRISVPVEHIVVLNRCTDRTEAIAARYGARLVRENAKNLSRIRNRGIAASRGDIIVTIDADSRMTLNMLAEVQKRIDSVKYIGGGVKVLPDRLSIGIFFSLLVAAPFILREGVSAGMFWFRKKDFDAIGGFDENLVCVEDLDFGKRLKRYGKKSGKRYGTIWNEHIVTSCRKFDYFGDWFFIKHPGALYRILRRNPDQAKQFYYDPRS